MKILGVYLNWLRPCRGWAAGAVVLSGLAAVAEGVALAALIPILDVFSGRSSPMLDRVLAALGWQPQGPDLLLACLAAFVALALVAAGTRAAAEILGLWIKARVETSMRHDMTEALLQMTWSQFVKLRQGDIGKAMVLEGMQVGTGAMLAVSAFGALLAALCYLLISFAVSVDLTLMALAFGVFGGVLFLLASRAVRRYADQLSHLVGDIGDKSAELFGNLKYFRATGMEQTLRERSARLFDHYGRTYLLSQLFNPLLRSGIEVLAAVFIAGFLYYHLAVLEGSVAEVLVFLGLFYRMVPRILSAQSFLFQARTYLTWHETFEARLAEARAHGLASAGNQPARFEQALRFEHVSFAYPGGARPVLQDVDLTIRRGECIALVGSSGGGKTTITDLLTGLVQPVRGHVMVDGVDLATIDLLAWRQQIGLVMQEPLVLHASVAANVAMSEAPADQQAIERALRAADAWEFVSELPQGMDTPVAEKGARLSGGQRQRIAIARALYRHPQLLIMDEATSALDGDAEQRVQSVIEAMKGQTTLVIVAHRLKTVRMADRIVVLEAGGIAESGTWDELMARQGVFHRMACTQGLA